MANKKLKVMEVYSACQGEGQFIGQRCVFIRLFGCNFRCTWCDTAYAINQKEWEAANSRPQFEEYPYAEYTADELMHEVRALTHPSKGFGIVITGGEPTLHQDALTTLLRKLHNAGFNTTVETNGTIVPQGLPEWYGQTWDKSSLLWSISPKLPSAGDRAWIDFDTLGWFAAVANVQLKFVVSDVTELEMALGLVEGLEMSYPLAHPIIFQPEGSALSGGIHEYMHTLKTLQNRAVTILSDFDIRVLPQLHILLHGREARSI